MINEINNYVTSISSLIELPLRRTLQGSVLYSTLFFIVFVRDKACLVSTNSDHSQL
jgi:hypothetical protein